MGHRFEDLSRDLIKLAGRIAQRLSYGATRDDVVRDFRVEGYSVEEIRLAYAAAEMMLGWVEEGTR